MSSLFLTSLIGKTVAKASRLKGGHGSALPGLVVEKIDPYFLRKVLSELPHGVAVISGTNGKTTTTKMVVELLRASGLKVFTNDSGSNFTRGVASSALAKMKRGKLDADIAVLELDEAHAVHFVREIKPNFCLLLNVLRDQLDRFGEIDTTAKMLETVAKNTTDTVVLNRDDPLIAKIAESLDQQKVTYFGYAPNMDKDFPSDEQLHAAKKTSTETKSADVELVQFNGSNATYKIDNKDYNAKLRLNGSHNILNGAAALALVKAILTNQSSSHLLRGSVQIPKEIFRNKPKNNNLSFNPTKMIAALEKVKPAFGRGETIEIDGQSLELILVKNPAGFRLALKSQSKKSAATTIAVNDQYADGRDMSWLWDVDFGALPNVAIVSGIRAYDMALRLEYNEVSVGFIEPDLRAALSEFLSREKGRPKQIFCTYTAMLSLRKMLESEAKK